MLISTLQIQKDLKYKAFNKRLLKALYFTLANKVKQRPWCTIKARTLVTLPKKLRIYTVLRSTHTDKKAREQFEIRTYSRLLRFSTSVTLKKANLLNSYGCFLGLLRIVPAGLGYSETSNITLTLVA
jgi:ribosomal protein S10